MGGRRDLGGVAGDPSIVGDVSELLPIGDEPVEESIRWARVDAELRGVSMGEALACRAAAHAALDAHRDAWDAAITEVEDGDRFTDAVAVASESGVTLALVTAFNPMTVELSPEDNERRNEMLFDEFRPPLRSIGRSVDGGWSEPGFAMPMGPEAIGAAQRFGQAAIYVVSPAGRSVLVVVGASPDQLARASLGA